MCVLIHSEPQGMKCGGERMAHVQTGGFSTTISTNEVVKPEKSSKCGIHSSICLSKQQCIGGMVKLVIMKKTLTCGDLEHVSSSVSQWETEVGEDTYNYIIYK